MQALLLVLVSIFCITVHAGHPAKPQPPKQTKKPSSPYQEKFVQYGAENGTVMEGFLVYPKSVGQRPNSAPAVIVFHAFTGRTEFDNQKARDLAKLGYVAFAADVYGKGVASNDTNENFGIMGQLLAERDTTLQRRGRAAWAAVNNLPFVNGQKVF
ncbi:hypothetical protein OESDEN_18037 [Oesophagostomum dentatum]|uniref:Dienelactone hydrolase domain-containing protein n=1 Tax=Oesophagostomum dentatum TaxID=61180 RepID=A0A0B1SEF3_OESDE|nr:hypothetical protein OESDEN_18037 [Oesophagostomum dentatum]